MSETTEFQMIQRSIVLELLRDEHSPHWTLAELTIRSSTGDPEEVTTALKQLKFYGVVSEEPGAQEGYPIYSVVRAVRHIDTLELIGI